MGDSLSTIADAVAVLERGGIVVVPTDTVYGLAARADRPDAIERLVELKMRPPQKAVQLLVADVASLDLFGRPSDRARALARKFWPGALTIVVAASTDAPEALVADGTIGLRAPDHSVALELITSAGPLAASSANASGQPTPATIDEIREIFGRRVEIYLEGGRVEGLASTVVDVSGDDPRILREGVITPSEIFRTLQSGFEAG